MKSALVTGIAGQCGAYLAEHLLKHGYVVHGIARTASYQHTENIDGLIREFPHRLNLHWGDILDSGFLHRVLDLSGPSEVYSLAALSDVAASFAVPDMCVQTNAVGPTRLLEAIRRAGAKSIRFYQASTSELFGDSNVAQSELTPFHPMSPYAAAKLAAFWMVRTYRDGYGMHASNGILFNTESKLRADCFVTQKIAKFVARWKRFGGDIAPLRLGNLDAKRDWSHAADMVRGMHMILQQDHGDDYVLASGETRSVREFVDEAFRAIGLAVEWPEPNIGRVQDRTAVVVDPKFMRPLDVPVLQGDASKAHRVLGWRPTILFEQLVREMVDAASGKRHEPQA